MAQLLPYLAAVHDNDENGQARLAFQSTWPELHPGRTDGCAWPDCEEPTELGHKHGRTRGTVQGTHVVLWGADTDETTLVVVGDVEAAALLYRAGLHSLYTPVTWFEARADYPQGSISNCDWSAVSGREVVIWLDEDAVSSGRLGLVANRVIEAGAASLHVVDSSAPIGDDATEVLIALESRRPFGAGDVSPGSGAARAGARTGRARDAGGTDRRGPLGARTGRARDARGTDRRGPLGARTGRPRSDRGTALHPGLNSPPTLDLRCASWQITETGWWGRLTRQAGSTPPSTGLRRPDPSTRSATMKWPF